MRMPDQTDVISEMDLEWIQLQNLIAHKEESVKERIIRKNKENPFVIIGCMATLAALSYGLWTFRQGRRKMSQYMMRTRIVAQGFTVMAFVIGMGIAGSKAEK